MALTDKIWFTYKSRIAAENRLKSNDFHSQSLLVWYALVSAVGSIASIQDSNYLGTSTSFLSSIMAVALLVLSLWVTNQDWRGRAIKMRENHLELLYLYNLLKENRIEYTAAAEKYHKLLSQCENHKTYDLNFFKVFDSDAGLSTPATCYVIFSTSVVRIFRFLVWAILYGVPLAIYFYFKVQ
ncbi:SLATT domain-containing protein [Comamonas testosteroni]|uniref:SLATT domain-containing protein n=1 Tax=Comamonas testosteroni TaxID=285 RepID=UPI0012D32EF4|nr:SLATT domain-containing protein [Comamonas testosteroni]